MWLGGYVVAQPAADYIRQIHAFLALSRRRWGRRDRWGKCPRGFGPSGDGPALGQYSDGLLGRILDAPQARSRGFAGPPIQPSALDQQYVPEQVAGSIVAEEESHLMEPLADRDDGLDARLDRPGVFGCFHAETSWMP
jgi:hypothetical protein